MSLKVWILVHGVMIFFWLWVLRWGGAKWLEGWKTFFLSDWISSSWNAEQIKLYALCVLVLEVIWFLLGIGVPEWRGFP